jgi:hypothetical protein
MFIFTNNGNGLSCKACYDVIRFSGVSTGNIHGEDDDDGWDFDENIQYDEHGEKV